MNTLKSKTPEYSALLDTPHGRSYEASVGSTAVIKQFASLFSDEPEILTARPRV